jgi:hypothetical protein
VVMIDVGVAVNEVSAATKVRPEPSDTAGGGSEPQGPACTARSPNIAWLLHQAMRDRLRPLRQPCKNQFRP